MKVQYISTIRIIHFRALERLHAARAFLRLHGASGQVGPKSGPGAALRRTHSDSSVSKNLNEVHKMKEINLREYYPFYNMDVYLEVSDEIAGQLDRFKLDDEAHRVRILRAKAYFSLDRGDGIEKDALQKPPQSLELILRAEQAARLDAALRALSDCQRRRILAFYLDGESKAKIAKRENVNESAVRKSIRTGLTALKKFLNAE